MKLEISSNKAQFVAKGLIVVADFLHEHREGSVVIFCNSRKQSQHLTVHLEKKLDTAKLSIDVPTLKAHLTKLTSFGGLDYPTMIAIVTWIGSVSLLQ